jgi:PAS domain S-box-containing protein
MVGARIMVVEDERITAEDIKDGLEDLGYQVPAVVPSGEQAIIKAEELEPDLVLMDIRLEGPMDGIEAAENIRSRFGIPVIYLTAYSDENTVERAKITEPSGYILKGAVGYINKPFEEGELHTTIQITLYKNKMERRLRENQRWLNEVLRNLSDAVIATDARMQIKLINQVAEEITGCLQEDALGNDIRDVLNPVSGQLGLMDPDDVSMAYRVDLSPEETIQNKEGINVVIHGVVSPIKNERGKIEGWVVVFREKK